jgi:hypothetical protein
VRGGIVLAEVMGVVGRDRTNTHVAREIQERAAHFVLQRTMMMVQFQEKSILKNLPVRFDERTGAGHLILEQVLLHPAAQTARQDDQSAPMLGEQIEVDARLVVVAVDIGLRNELDQIAVALCIRREDGEVVFVARASVPVAAGSNVHLASQNGLDPLRLRRKVELERTVQNPVIGERDRGHVELFGGVDEVVNPARAVEERVFTMYVEVNEAARHETPVERVFAPNSGSLRHSLVEWLVDNHGNLWMDKP